MPSWYIVVSAVTLAVLLECLISFVHWVWLTDHYTCNDDRAHATALGIITYIGIVWCFANPLTVVEWWQTMVWPFLQSVMP